MTRNCAITCLFIAACAIFLPGSHGQTGAQREYSIPEQEARLALQEIGAFNEEKLPVLEGFAKFDEAQRSHYLRAFYTFQVAVQRMSDHSVLIRPQAKISAWVEQPHPLESSYRLLPSTGRLEMDLLDRLSDYLTRRPGTGMTAEVLQQEIDSLRAQREELTLRGMELQTKIAEMEGALKMQSGAPNPLALLTSERARVLASPDKKSRILFMAKADDEFPVLEENASWVRVRLQGNQSGWLARQDMRDIGASSENSATISATFPIIREVVQPFEGDWKPLQGKNALFVFTELSHQVPLAEASKARLKDALKIFYDHRDSANAENVHGIVIVFPGGVAAATVDDVARWAAGRLREPEFLSRCSLDPMHAFETASRETAKAKSTIDSASGPESLR